MNTFMLLVRSAVAITVVVCFVSTPLFAQEKEDAAKKLEAEVTEAMGTFPLFMKAMPEHLRAGVWEWTKAALSGQSPIPGKYNELIALAVASQIPCDYCVYGHTAMAKVFGATDDEIKAAIAQAAYTRHWSTVMNGSGVPLEEANAEWDRIMEHMMKKGEAEKTTKK